MKNKRLLLCCLLLMASSLFSQQMERRRGKFLRTEVKSTDVQEQFSVEMVTTDSSLPTFLFKKRQKLTHHEVKIYQLLMEMIKPNNGKGITERGTVTYIPVPDEVYEGEKSDRIEIKELGPLLNESFTVNGHPIQTDAQGQCIDSAQWLLAQFDNLSQKEILFKISHKSLGSNEIKITRNLIFRETEQMPGVVQIPTFDLLASFRQDFTQLKQSDVQGIAITAQLPNQAKPGEIVPIILEVNNKGTKATSCLLGRSFSSEPTLNGKIFYFGSIYPGQKRSFTRLVQMPDKPNAKLYGTISFWSILGEAHEKAFNFSITLQDAPKKDAP